MTLVTRGAVTASPPPVGVLAWACVLAPALLIGSLVYRYGVDVPYWDEWVIAGLLQQVDQGTLTVRDIFAQHNEHRPAVQRLVQLAQASLGGWKMRAMMALTQLLLLAMLAGCVLLWRHGRCSARPWGVAPLAITALLVFTPAQHQNLFWAFQFCFLMPSAGLLAGTVAAASPRLSLGAALAWAAVGATLATFSLLAGILIWPLSALAVMLMRGVPTRGTLRPWLLWTATAAAVLGAYFHGYAAPTNSPSILNTLKQPLILVGGYFACLGSAFGLGAAPVPRATTAIVSGVAGVMTYLWLVLRAWRMRDRIDPRQTAPWIVMGLFALAAGAAITVGRIGYGLGTVFEPRYCSITIWLFVACVMLAARAQGAVPGRPMVPVQVVAPVVLMLSVAAYPFHVRAITTSYRERLAAQAVYTFAEVAPKGWPNIPAELDASQWTYLTSVLQQIERTGWRQPRPTAPAWVEATAAASDCRFGVVEDRLDVRGRVMADGWAYLPGARRPADAVLATTGADRRLVGLAPLATGRVDVRERFGLRAVPISGWFFDMTLKTAAPPLRFWALDVTRLEAYPLCLPASAVQAATER
ncbi:MAG: hypothetical protein AB7N65_03955 [Vicinamibacterales bacterium]